MGFTSFYRLEKGTSSLERGALPSSHFQAQKKDGLFLGRPIGTAIKFTFFQQVGSYQLV